MDLRQSLDYGTISGVVTKKREKAILAIPSTMYEPNGDKVVILDGFAVSVSQAPVAEGQLILYVEAATQFNRIYNLMVAISINGTLQWVATDVGSFRFVPSGPLPPVGEISEV